MENRLSNSIVSGELNSCAISKILEKKINYADLIESKIMVLMDIVLPYLSLTKKQYKEIISGVTECDDTLSFLNETDNTLFLNLSVLCWSLKTDLHEINERGVLIPMILIYKSVADVWSNEFECSIAEGEALDPMEVFAKGKGKKVYEKGIELLKTAGCVPKNIITDLDENIATYIKAEAFLADNNWTKDEDNGEERNSRDILTKYVILRSLSFGKMAEVLTNIASTNYKDMCFQEKCEAAQKMHYFAILGGMIDEFQDNGEYGDMGSCLAKIDKNDIKKLTAFLFSKLL